MKRVVPIWVLYIFFALIAMAVNLGTQLLAFRIFGPEQLGVGIFLGTATGLVVKYLLDKRYIFNFRTETVAENTRCFMLYTVVGGATTALFWGSEWLAEMLAGARYTGAVIGLSLGYWVKYQLDRRFVFRRLE